LILCHRQQHKGGPASIRDKHRPLARRTLGPSRLLIELATR
jgi:hypothetical protein